MAMARSVIIVLLLKKTLRVLCVREVQNSIAESVHKLSQQIEILVYNNSFEIQNTTIFSRINGSGIYFEGIKHNVTKIKSMEALIFVGLRKLRQLVICHGMF